MVGGRTGAHRGGWPRLRTLVSVVLMVVALSGSKCRNADDIGRVGSKADETPSGTLTDKIGDYGGKAKDGLDAYDKVCRRPNPPEWCP